jgi:hypothetical protein
MEEQFHSHPWDEVISNAKEMTCFDDCTGFVARAVAQEGQPDADVWPYLARVTSFAVDVDAPDGVSNKHIDAFNDAEIELTKKRLN